MHIQSALAGAAGIAVLLLLAADPSLASQIDPESAVRGSLGVPLEELSLSNQFGALLFLLNGAFLLLYGLIALVILARRRRKTGAQSLATPAPQLTGHPWVRLRRDG